MRPCRPPRRLERLSGRARRAPAVGDDHARKRQPLRQRTGDDDAFVFGCETAGLPAAILAQFPPARRLRLPMRAGQRSLNLANAVAVTVFEAWRRGGFAGAG